MMGPVLLMVVMVKPGQCRHANAEPERRQQARVTAAAVAVGRQGARRRADAADTADTGQRRIGDGRRIGRRRIGRCRRTGSAGYSDRDGRTGGRVDQSVVGVVVVDVGRAAAAAQAARLIRVLAGGPAPADGGRSRPGRPMIAEIVRVGQEKIRVILVVVAMATLMMRKVVVMVQVGQ